MQVTCYLSAKQTSASSSVVDHDPDIHRACSRTPTESWHARVVGQQQPVIITVYTRVAGTRIISSALDPHNCVLLRDPMAMPRCYKA